MTVKPNTVSVRAWREKNPKRYEERKRLDYERRKMREAARWGTSPKPTRKRAEGPHEHTCVRAECREHYACSNACNLDSLSDSLCPKCFEEFQLS